MLSQRIRFQKRKIIGGSFLKNVYDKVRNVISSGSKILSRIPTGVKTQVKNLASPLLKKALEKIPTKLSLNNTLETGTLPTPGLSDRSRAILSNLIAGSGFRNYVSKH